MNTTVDRADLFTILAAEGVTSDPASLARLADAARSTGVSEVLVSIMVDDRERVAPRVRAYGRVSAQVAARTTAIAC